MLQPLIAEIEALSVPPTKRLCHLAAAPDVRTFLVSEIFVQGSTEMTVLYSSIPELSSLTSWKSFGYWNFVLCRRSRFIHFEVSLISSFIVESNEYRSFITFEVHVSYRIFQRGGQMQRLIAEIAEFVLFWRISGIEPGFLEISVISGEFYEFLGFFGILRISVIYLKFHRFFLNF